MTTPEKIKSKLELLKKLDSGLNVFGAKQHGYSLQPPLPLADILQFEEKHRVTLPDEYREFLMQAGNGGAGPYYGLYSLAQSYEENQWFALDTINKPSPFGPGDSKDGGNYEIPAGELPDDTDIYDGSIMLAHLGCGMFANLIISGPQRGKVWYDHMSSHDTIQMTNLTFYDWYLNWLNNSLQGFSQLQLASKAFELMMARRFVEAIELYKLALHTEPGKEGRDLSLYCNALYVLQHDNTGLPVNKELNLLFLEKSLAFGPQNPAIYFNAACLYMEMNDLEKVYECIQLAKQYEFIGYEEMLAEMEESPMFRAFVEDERYSAIFNEV